MHLAGIVTSEKKADVSGSLSLTLADLVWNRGVESSVSAFDSDTNVDEKLWV